jgi:streptogramin lyase
LQVPLALAVALLLALPAVGRAVTVRTFRVPSPAADLHQIVAGPDGALWFTEKGANKVASISTAGQITEYPIPTTPRAWPTRVRPTSSRAAAGCGS